MESATASWIKRECEDGFIRFINSPNVNLVKMIAKAQEGSEDKDAKETV